VIVVAVALVDVRGAIGFAGVTVLTYYAVTNAACLTLRPDQRRWPRAIAVGGLVGCVALAAALPLSTVLAGIAVLAVGVAGRAVLRRDQMAA
jgi:APA family basic amino acid/polyamine antiporter